MKKYRYFTRHKENKSKKKEQYETTEATYIRDFPNYKDDKKKENEKMRKEKFPTQMRTTSPHKLIICPTNCTQHRTKSFRLSEKKTFDPKKGFCHNCTFKTVPAGAVFHGPEFKRASNLPKVKSN